LPPDLDGIPRLNREVVGYSSQGSGVRPTFRNCILPRSSWNIIRPSPSS